MFNINSTFNIYCSLYVVYLSTMKRRWSFKSTIFVMIILFAILFVDKCNAKVEDCLEYTDEPYNTTCSKCTERHYLNTSTLCLPCIDDCITCNDGLTCEVCKKGKYFESDKGKCVDCNPRCKACTSSIRCTECADGYFRTVRTCITERVYVLFMLGLLFLGISSIALIVCILRCILSSLNGKYDPKTFPNLFQVEAD